MTTEEKRLDAENINDKQIRDFLKLFEGKNLVDHYSFKDEIKCTIEDEKGAREFLKNNKPIIMTFEDGILYYRLTGEEDQQEVFPVDISFSFNKSDIWLSDKITPVSKIFPNLASAPISSEMTSFYVCLIVASVLQEDFMDEFNSVTDTYDFKKWRQTDTGKLDFTSLSGEWIQLGSKTIKMIAAAAKYVIVRERSKKEIRSILGLSEEMDLQLNNMIKELSEIRYHYDNLILSPENKAKMSRLEIKNKIAERDKKLEQKQCEDPKLYQLWRLMNLNSNNLLPYEVRRYIRKAREQAYSVFLDLSGREPDYDNTDDLLALKKIQDKLKKEAIRASLNKLFANEVNKLKSDPDNYVAPSFL